MMRILHRLLEVFLHIFCLCDASAGQCVGHGHNKLLFFFIDFVYSVVRFNIFFFSVFILVDLILKLFSSYNRCERSGTLHTCINK